MRPALLLLALLGCGPDETAPTAADTALAPDACESHDDQVTWETGGEAFFLANCRSCHSETAEFRAGAPDYLNYDTLAQVYAARYAIRQAALWDRVMPPSSPLNADDTETLASFLDCLE